MFSDKKKSVLIISGGIIILCGILFTSFDIRFRPFEYDEIWTLLKYTELPVFDIFRDLSTPNNHPLHSLLCKASIAVFGGSDCFSMRLPAFLAGILLLSSLCMVLVHSRKLTVVLTGTAFLAFNPCFLEYLSTARGYSMQMLFIFLFCILLFRNNGSYILRNTLALFLLGAAACLTITSGLVFVCAAYGAWFLTLLPCPAAEWKNILRKHAGPLLAGLLFLAFALLWYGWNYAVIAQGQVFGVSLFHNPANYFHALWIVLRDTGILPIAALSAVGLCSVPIRKYSIFALSFTTLALLSSVITCAGPPRVYLPTLCILSVSAAHAADFLLMKLWFIDGYLHKLDFLYARIFG